MGIFTSELMFPESKRIRTRIGSHFTLIFGCFFMLVNQTTILIGISEC